MPFSYKDYTGDGSTTTFSITFDYQKESEISVTVDGVAQSGFTFPSSTQVQLTTAPAASTLVRIRRTTALSSREVDFASGSVLTEEDLDNSNIQVFHAAQEAIDTSNDAISLDDDDKWDANSKVIKNVANPVNAQDAATKDYLENTWLTPSDKTQLNALDTDNLDTVADDIANVNTVATNIADVNTVANRDADIDTVAARDTDIGTVAARDANIGTVASRDADIGTVANRDTDIGTVAARDADIGTVADDLDLASPKITTVSTNITNVNNVGNDISNVNTVATDIANVNTVAGKLGAGQDITVVATNISDVTTVSGIDANVTTVAGISADVTAVANISQDIQDVQDEIANLQTVANDLNEATSEIETVAASIANVDLVGADISNVNTVASNISDVNSFADTYSISATAPASPTIGDLWFDSTNDVMKVYASGGFINAGSAVNGTSNRKTYTVGTSEGSYTGSTTVFPIEYDAGYIDVFLNGIKLDPDNDFTATNGTSVTLSSAAATGDVVDMVGYGTFELSNFSVGDANDVDLTGLADDQFLQYDSATSKFKPATIATDVSGDSSPQLGGNLDVNGNNINFGDNDKALFGASDDLEIYHSGTASHIKETGTGNLKLEGSNIELNNGAGTKTYLLATDGGAVQLRYNDTTKLATTSTGVSVTGSTDLNGGELILDADGDTSITADTDDRIDIKVAGSDRYTFSETDGKLKNYEALAHGGSNFTAPNSAGEILDSLVSMYGEYSGIGYNVYYDASSNGWKYIGNGEAAMQQLDGNGNLRWHTASNNTSGGGASAPLLMKLQLTQGGTLFAQNGFAMRPIKSVNLTTSYQDIVEVDSSLGDQGQGWLVAMSSENSYHQTWIITRSNSILNADYWGGDQGHGHSKDVQWRVSGGHVQAKKSLSTGRPLAIFMVAGSLADDYNG